MFMGNWIRAQRPMHSICILGEALAVQYHRMARCTCMDEDGTRIGHSIAIFVPFLKRALPYGRSDSFERGCGGCNDSHGARVTGKVEQVV